MTDTHSTYFNESFEALTRFAPLPWQSRLFERFAAQAVPEACDIPTGLGKTSVIAIWLLALAHHARSGTVASFPRRLVYVVNRRTVVDQATSEVTNLRKALVDSGNAGLRQPAESLCSLGTDFSNAPLAISTLRGQFADKGEWSIDPARPSVILGTVDMIGSRLLFSGYGRGFKSRPLHAGFLGQDALLVHDEAHLEPAFQRLVESIVDEQSRCKEFKRLRVMALTATSRSTASSFTLDDEVDRKHVLVRQRIYAKKGLAFHPIGDEKGLSDAIITLCLSRRESGKAILVFLRRLDDVEKTVDRLRKENLLSETLTGTMRGFERDGLVKDSEVFARFLPKAEVPSQAETVYLICTSAGEVGIDISADHMICDLTPFDSMAQRFGRVNRYGLGSAEIDVVYAAAKTAPEDSIAEAPVTLEEVRARTLTLLQQLPLREDGRFDAGPAALGDLPAVDRQEAFTPPPVIVRATDILFDAWALTSIRGKLAGRPPVADWLHGIAENELPETYVAWRDEVEIISGDLLAETGPDELRDMLEDYPLKPHELLRDRTDRIYKQLERLAAHHGEAIAWLVTDDGSVRPMPVKVLVEAKGARAQLTGATILLPPRVGGLDHGVFHAGVPWDESGNYDVSDRWADGLHQPDARLRCRLWDDEIPPKGMRLVRTVDTQITRENESEESDGESPRRRYWNWYVRPRAADDDGSRTARKQQQLKPHLETAEHYAAQLVRRLGLAEDESCAVLMAARWHDLGKCRATWQLAIGNRDYPAQVLAKSGKLFPLRSHYRHELGSILDLAREREFRDLSPDIQILVMHMIAAHHGRARPHFPEEEVFDPERTDEEVTKAVLEIPQRFAWLQQKYGRWGLAYLESLVRAADAMASQSIDTALERDPIRPGNVPEETIS